MKRVNHADILCIGAQRAMTSWLHNVLSLHPPTWAFPDFSPVTSTRKEAHFWDWNHHRGREWYRFLMTPLDDRSLKSMDFTPDYALLNEDQIKECKALNPDARVIYILRDPLARAVSALRMHTMWATGHAPVEQGALTFDQAFLDRTSAARLQAHADYAGNLRRWRQCYPDLLVLDYAALASDPGKGVARVLEHCGLPVETLTARPGYGERLGKRIWQAPQYPLSTDCLNFLDGMLWRERQTAEAETGIRFRPEPPEALA